MYTNIYIHINTYRVDLDIDVETYIYVTAIHMDIPKHITTMNMDTFHDGYCSTVQGLLNWFEVDLGILQQ